MFGGVCANCHYNSSGFHCSFKGKSSHGLLYTRRTVDTDRIKEKDSNKASKKTKGKEKAKPEKANPVTPAKGTAPGTPGTAGPSKAIKKRRASRGSLINGVISSLQAATAMLEILKEEIEEDNKDDK